MAIVKQADSLFLHPNIHVVKNGDANPWCISLHIREFSPQVVRQALDDLGSPAFASLPFQDVAPDLPVEQNQFPVG